ncbi:hypothetical protein LCGC14_1306270 [marine sediment metagenome]|uniref:Uncharacterized protein n=1 Tax=marine sediment metagenome TaxID=412755 RepID=A0A0F9NR34_9ZZZZ
MKRYPKVFTSYWNGETRGYCGILEKDDFKHEAYLAWKAGRAHEKEIHANSWTLLHRQPAEPTQLPSEVTS